MRRTYVARHSNEYESVTFGEDEQPVVGVHADLMVFTVTAQGPETPQPLETVAARSMSLGHTRVRGQSMHRGIPAAHHVRPIIHTG